MKQNIALYTCLPYHTIYDDFKKTKWPRVYEKHVQFSEQGDFQM